MIETNACTHFIKMGIFLTAYSNNASDTVSGYHPQGLGQMFAWCSFISTVIWKVHLQIIALLQTTESRGNIIRIIYPGQSKWNPLGGRTPNHHVH